MDRERSLDLRQFYADLTAELIKIHMSWSKTEERFQPMRTEWRY